MIDREIIIISLNPKIQTKKLATLKIIKLHIGINKIRTIISTISHLKTTA